MNLSNGFNKKKVTDKRKERRNDFDPGKFSIFSSLQRKIMKFFVSKYQMGQKSSVLLGKLYFFWRKIKFSIILLNQKLEFSLFKFVKQILDNIFKKMYSNSTNLFYFESAFHTSLLILVEPVMQRLKSIVKKVVIVWQFLHCIFFYSIQKFYKSLY